MEMDGVFDEEKYFIEKVTIDKWARTRRQRILQNISFESEVFNIYDPNFSSDDDEPVRVDQLVN